MPHVGSAYKNRRLLISAVLLSLALFAWGLRYKTSLYHHVSDLHSSWVSPAKLLSEAERCRDAKRADSSLQARAAHPHTSFALPEHAKRDEKASIAQPPHPSDFEAPPRPPSIRCFYLRPPPGAFLGWSV